MSKEKQLSDALASIVAGFSNCSLYSSEHPAVEEFSRKALILLEDLFDEDSLTLTLLADSFIFNEKPVPITGYHIDRFIKKLNSKGIERIVIKKGLPLQELKDFITALGSREETVSSSNHLAVGMLELRYKGEKDISTPMDEVLAKVRGTYDEISRFNRLDIRGIEDAVAGFMIALKREANVLRNLGTVKSHSAYTYLHAANVSMLTIFQAESLGFSGSLLHDVGIAGLLHDVGKLFVGKEIIEKNTSLDDNEWNIMKLHPAYGALYLSNHSDVPKLAVIAAYEHHMKYKGNGYPSPKRWLRGQHFVSQLVAISDFFDALRTKREYRAALSTLAIIEMLKKDPGKDFNPVLIENFLNALQRMKVS